MRAKIFLVCAVAAIVPFQIGSASAQSRFFSFERGVDRPGMDYDNGPSNGPVDCSFVCQSENRCRAWTYVRPGIQGPNGRCWLKVDAPRAQGNDCCVSGVRRARAVMID